MDNDIKPSYYKGFDQILDLYFSEDELIAAAEFNILKYLYRWRHKNGIEDLKKAKTYLDLMINRLEHQNDKANDKINDKIQQRLRDIERNP